MTEPRRPLVTIDDPVTIIEPHRVLLEWVEIVERQGFRVRSRRGRQGDEVYSHDQEGTTWARGHHLPDSEVVVSLRAAASLVPATPAAPETPAQAPATSNMVSNAAMQRLVQESQMEYERAVRKPPWWNPRKRFG